MPAADDRMGRLGLKWANRLPMLRFPRQVVDHRRCRELASPLDPNTLSVSDFASLMRKSVPSTSPTLFVHLDAGSPFCKSASMRSGRILIHPAVRRSFPRSPRGVRLSLRCASYSNAPAGRACDWSAGLPSHSVVVNCPIEMAACPAPSGLMGAAAISVATWVRTMPAARWLRCAAGAPVGVASQGGRGVGDSPQPVAVHPNHDRGSVRHLTDFGTSSFHVDDRSG
jgi:hypothetical protein